MCGEAGKWYPEGRGLIRSKVLCKKYKICRKGIKRQICQIAGGRRVERDGLGPQTVPGAIGQALYGAYRGCQLWRQRRDSRTEVSRNCDESNSRDSLLLDIMSMLQFLNKEE